MKTKIERRQFGRKTSTIQAWILVAGRPRVPCRVLNISARGALLELPPPKWLPFQFDLFLDGSSSAISCEIRHVTAHGVGVHFQVPAAIEQPDTPMTDFCEQDRWSGLPGSGVISSAARQRRIR
ncbi:MAG: PilZ domain-containing protein [Hyphomicrobiaceae bacterium]